MFEVDEWWVRLWDYPRLQIAAALLAVLASLALVGPRRGRTFWAALASGSAAIAWQLGEVAPYLPGWPRAVPSAANCPAGNRLRLLNANVLLGNKRYGDLLALARRTDPDLVLLLEPGPDWERAIIPLHSRYPFRIGEPVPNSYGMILLSKLPLEQARIRYLLQPGVPSIAARLRLRSGQAVDFYGVHPEPPLPGDDSGERDAELVLVGREVRRNRRAAIVLGDLNDVAWSHTSRLFRRLAGMGDPRVGRGPYPTFPADYPWLSWPLDHVFVSPHFALLDMGRVGDIGSDHRPMLFDLCLVQKADRPVIRRAAPREIREDARDEVAEGREERAEEANGR